MKQCEASLISVLMGVLYRRENVDLLERSIQSIQSQTYPNWELLICDDGSAAAALRYLEKAADQCNQIRLIRGCRRLDLASKLNLCLSEARGANIARMDDDDFSASARFECQVDYLKSHPETGFVGSNVRLCRNGEIVGIRQLPRQPKIRDFLFAQPFVHPALMFRRDVLLSVGGYSEDKRCLKCEDYDLLLRLYAHGYHGDNLQEYLLDYSIPNTAKGSRTMSDRWNESVTRWRRFSELNLLPGALPYVAKPLVVGLVPERMLDSLKRKRMQR